MRNIFALFENIHCYLGFTFHCRLYKLSPLSSAVIFRKSLSYGFILNSSHNLWFGWEIRKLSKLTSCPENWIYLFSRWGFFFNLTLYFSRFVFVSFAGLATSFLHHGYLVNYYNAHRSVFVNDSMILELTNRFLTDDPKDNFVSCNVIVTTSASRRIHMHFLSLEISYDDDSVDRYVLLVVSLFHLQWSQN